MQSQIKLANFWDTLKIGGGGTPDLYNACNNNVVGVPHNSLSFQKANTGIAYSGIISYYKTTNTSREYIQNKLLEKLESNKSYCVTFYVNLANISTRAIDQLGIYFDDGSIYTPFYEVASFVTPQIQSSPGIFITDTLGWTKIQGTFIANGTEEYLTVGNFKTDALTNTITVSNNSIIYSYYNIDDVSVIDADTKAHAGDNKLVCLGDSVFIGRQPEIGLECEWFNNSTQVAVGAGIWVKPTTTQQYVIKQDVCGTISYDTVQVILKDDKICNPKTDGTFVIPNTFTPNADGVNDTFLISLGNTNQLNSFEVYNRWGNLIHQTTNNLFPTTVLWDGRTTSGEPCNDGVYFYVLKYTDTTGEKQSSKGYISLFR